MARPLNSSGQTRALLAALLEDAGRWRYGYDLSRETGLKSGTLYPILMRLERQGWLDTSWEEPSTPGRPARHLYRLTAGGKAEAVAALTAVPPAAAARSLEALA